MLVTCMNSRAEAPRSGDAGERPLSEHSLDRLQELFLFEAGPAALDVLLAKAGPSAEQSTKVIDKLDKIIAAMQWKAGTAAERERLWATREDTDSQSQVLRSA